MSLTPRQSLISPEGVEVGNVVADTLRRRAVTSISDLVIGHAITELYFHCIRIK
jgi:hypothetical protein